jgi:hypothetical protein
VKWREQGGGGERNKDGSRGEGGSRRQEQMRREWRVRLLRPKPNLRGERATGKRGELREAIPHLWSSLVEGWKEFLRQHRLCPWRCRSRLLEGVMVMVMVQALLSQGLCRHCVRGGTETPRE